MDTQNYKRTLAGSVGAGMGALLGSSGKTYFIIEHKTSSKYHQAGESQKIIIDQVELGRASSCQIRFDESFETVSRRHAAIMKEGNNWKLVHLSQSNPTLVNGTPINGSYYLQTGDEIQLAVGGPRMGFIIPQGRQALTSSIGLTERMSLFRKQALRPYKTALTTMAVLFVIAIAIFTVLHINLKNENDLQASMIEQQSIQHTAMQDELNRAGNELRILAIKEDSLRRAYDIARQTGEKNEAELAATNAELNTIRGEYEKVKRNYYSVKSEVDKLSDAISTSGTRENGQSEQSTNLPDKAAYSVPVETTSYTKYETASSNASSDLSTYYGHIYTLKIDRIDIEDRGRKFDPGIQLSDIVCGTGFMLDDGTFITDRQNIEPWIYTNTEQKEYWKELLSIYKAAGCNVIIHYRAYSTRGTGAPLVFTNEDFHRVSSEDLIVKEIEIRREFRVELRKHGVEINYHRRNFVKVTQIAPTSYSWAFIDNKGPKGEGLPYNLEMGENLPGGTEIHMIGYAGYAPIKDLRPAHFNDKTNIADTKYNTVILQNRVMERGYYGSPAFIKTNDGKYHVMGLMVGSIDGKDRVVPISNIYKY